MANILLGTRLIDAGGVMQLLESSLALDQFFARLDASQTGALILDYDGTLAPFCTDRSKAFPYPGVSEALLAIMQKGRTRIAIVSGRPVEEIIPLLGIFPFPEIWALDGLQHLTSDGECRTVLLSDFDTEILFRAEACLDHDGLRHLAEIKTGSIAVHVRGLTEENAEIAYQRVRRGWERLAASGRTDLLEFDCGIEIRLKGRNKADIVRTFLQGLEPGVPLAYLGDDRSDEDAFTILREVSQALTVLVREQWRDTHAKAWIKPPEELLDFFQRWIDCCGYAI
jgi:trehalose-phosphatase